MASLAQRLGRDTVLYALASVGVFAFGLINIAVLTRMLTVDEFGEFALYLLLSAMLTVLYNAGSLQGALLVTFGAGEAGEEASKAGGDPRTTLTTALVLTLGIASAGTIVLWLLSAPLAELISGNRARADRVVLAAAAGAFGALWRLTLNVPRYERRAAMFVTLSTLRPILTVGLSVAFVVAGLGVDGALTGVALGTLVGALVSVAAARRAYGVRPSHQAIRAVTREGALFVPAVLGVWVVQNVDLYLLSAFHPSEVPLYRVASRLGAGVSYFVSAFLMAWIPLYNSASHAAAVRQHGATAIGARVLTYFLFASMWLVLSLAVLADLLIRVAPENYSAAATLIPIIGLGYVAYGFYVVIYRLARIPGKRRIYAILAAVAAGLFLLTSLVLIPPFGGYGAAVAQIIAFAVVSLVLYGFLRHSGQALPVEARRSAIIVGTAAGCLGTSVLIGPLLDDWRIVLDVVLLAAMPIVVIAAGGLPREEMRSAIRIVRRASPLRARASRRALRTRLAKLDATSATVLRSLLQDRRSPAEAGHKLGLDEEGVLLTAVESVRQLEQLADHKGEDDIALARYLFSTQSVAERDRLAVSLWAQGVDPAAASRLEETIARLRRFPRKCFKPSGHQGPAHPRQS